MILFIKRNDQLIQKLSLRSLDPRVPRSPPPLTGRPIAVICARDPSLDESHAPQQDFVRMRDRAHSSLSGI